MQVERLVAKTTHATMESSLKVKLLLKLLEHKFCRLSLHAVSIEELRSSDNLGYGSKDELSDWFDLGLLLMDKQRVKASRQHPLHRIAIFKCDSL